MLSDDILKKSRGSICCFNQSIIQLQLRIKTQIMRLYSCCPKP